MYWSCYKIQTIVSEPLLVTQTQIPTTMAPSDHSNDCHGSRMSSASGRRHDVLSPSSSPGDSAAAPTQMPSPLSLNLPRLYPNDEPMKSDDLLSVLEQVLSIVEDVDEIVNLGNGGGNDYQETSSSAARTGSTTSWSDESSPTTARYMQNFWLEDGAAGDVDRFQPQ